MRDAEATARAEAPGAMGRAARAGGDDDAAAPTPGAGERVRLSLAARYLLVNFVLVLAASVAIGWLVGQQIESSVLSRTSAVTSLYVQGFIEPHLQGLLTQPRLEQGQIDALSRLVTDTALGQRIVSFRVWSADGEVLYSPVASLIGRRFGVEDKLRLAAEGQVTADISDLSGAENVYERQRWSRLIEMYVPVRATGSARIIAVAEFYQLPDELDTEVGAARLRSWGLVALAAIVSYLLLARIIKQGSDTIVRQERMLRRQVSELSQLLSQNERLHERVRHAARRSTALNEQVLRRVSSDLHDGPGQALGLALLRLDVARSRNGSTGADALEADLVAVIDSVRDGLDDMRAVASGLRLPQLESRDLAEIAERVVEDHERRTGTHADLQVEGVPPDAPLPVKIALYRTLQEALSNATRHGAGQGVHVRLHAAGDDLHLVVSDAGPGFDPAGFVTNGHLGLAGMRERAELLGGTFRLDTARGQGTTVEAAWPLIEPEETWTTPYA